MCDEVGVTLNRLAREQMKVRLLADIAVDLQVCDLEGMDPSEYVRELRQMLADIGARLDTLGGTR